jgi:hypothetical protein
MAQQFDTSLLDQILRERGVRPVVISSECFDDLNALRSLRHFFRHAYGIPIDFAQLQSNLDKANRLQPIFERDLQNFLQLLRETTQGQ